MGRPPSTQPTELELLILKSLWDRSPQTVRSVREWLAETGRDLAHTTVITTLNVMVRKKYLRRAMQANVCLFSPRITRDEASHRMLGDVMNRVFDGSAKAVMLTLFDCADLDTNDLKELRRLIDDKVREQRK